MMNTMRKSISLLLTLLLTFSLVSVATAEGNTVLEGVYDMENNDFGMETFYHFNADGTYYASFFMGAVTDAGTYEIKDEELAYMVAQAQTELPVPRMTKWPLRLRLSSWSPM